jgi:hypothetical protein
VPPVIRPRTSPPTLSILIALLVTVLLGACARGRSEEDAAALASAREAQIRAEVELRTIRELAARQPPTPTEVASPPAAPATPAVAEVEPAPPAATTQADAGSSPCGCKTVACACVTVTISLAIAVRKPGNQDWDALGGAPDPQVTLRTPTGIKKSDGVTDLLATNVTFQNVALSPGDGVAVDAFDKDAMANDPIGTFSTTYQGRAAKVKGSMAAAAVTVEFRN